MQRMIVSLDMKTELCTSYKYARVYELSIIKLTWMGTVCLSVIAWPAWVEHTAKVIELSPWELLSIVLGCNCWPGDSTCSSGCSATSLVARTFGDAHYAVLKAFWIQAYNTGLNHLEPDPLSAFIITLHLQARYYGRVEKGPGPLPII
jgi:hypothetical protein